MSTIYNHVQRDPSQIETAKRPGRLTALTPLEENLVVTLLARYAEQRIPLRRAHLKEAIQIIISHMPAPRRMFLPFKNGSPGPKFLPNFTKQHKDSLRVARPQRQEANRFRACNAEALTTHMATLDKIITENCIDPSRIWNLDETGATPGKDANGKDNSRIYMTRAGAKDSRTDTFLNTNRVTMMPVISASGDMGAPLFFFKGKLLPYRVSLNNGRFCC